MCEGCLLSGDFVTKVSSVIDFVVIGFICNWFNRIRTFNVKSSSKPWFDIDLLRKFLTFSDKEIDEGNFKCAKLLLKKVVNNKETLYFEEKIAENIWIILKNSGEL